MAKLSLLFSVLALFVFAGLGCTDSKTTVEPGEPSESNEVTKDNQGVAETPTTDDLDDSPAGDAVETTTSDDDNEESNEDETSASPDFVGEWTLVIDEELIRQAVADQAANSEDPQVKAMLNEGMVDSMITMMKSMVSDLIILDNGTFTNSIKSEVPMKSTAVIEGTWTVDASTITMTALKATQSIGDQEPTEQDVSESGQYPPMIFVLSEDGKKLTQDLTSGNPMAMGGSGAEEGFYYVRK